MRVPKPSQLKIPRPAPKILRSEGAETHICSLFFSLRPAPKLHERKWKTLWQSTEVKTDSRIGGLCGGELLVKFDEDRPGTWIFHCHILDHADGGLLNAVHLGLPAEDFKPMSLH